MFHFLSVTHCLVWHILLQLRFFSCQVTSVCDLKDVKMHKQNFGREKYLDLCDPQSRHYKTHSKNVIGSPGIAVRLALQVSNTQ